MIKDIERLNKEIDRLMAEKMKADAQREVWWSKLIESIKEYKETFGVDLSGSNLDEVRANLEKEIGIVESAIKEDYDRANTLVGMINSGDISGAWAYIGGAGSSDRSESIEKPDGGTSLGGGSYAGGSEEEDYYGDEDDSIYFGSGGDSNFVLEPFGGSPVEVSRVVSPVSPDGGNFAKPINPAEEGKVKSAGGMVSGSEPVKPVDSKPVSPAEVKPVKPVGSFIIEDDDEDEFDSYGNFGGFGGILEGSKFEN